MTAGGRAATAGNPSPATFPSYKVFTPYAKETCFVTILLIAHKTVKQRKTRMP
jgi:hypothetical protein